MWRPLFCEMNAFSRVADVDPRFGVAPIELVSHQAQHSLHVWLLHEHLEDLHQPLLRLPVLDQSIVEGCQHLGDDVGGDVLAMQSFRRLNDPLGTACDCCRHRMPPPPQNAVDHMLLIPFQTALELPHAAMSPDLAESPQLSALEGQRA